MHIHIHVFTMFNPQTITYSTKIFYYYKHVNGMYTAHCNMSPFSIVFFYVHPLHTLYPVFSIHLLTTLDTLTLFLHFSLLSPFAWYMVYGIVQSLTLTHTFHQHIVLFTLYLPKDTSYLSAFLHP